MCPMVNYRVQPPLKVPSWSLCFQKDATAGEANSSLWPLLNPSTAPQKKAGEMPGTFFFPL